MKTSLIYFLLLFVIGSTTNAEAQKKELKTPMPAASIAGKFAGEITREELLDSPRLDVSDSSCTITSYRFATGTHAPYKEYTGHGNTLSAEMIAAIKAAAVGDRIIFEYMKCVNKDKESRMLRPIVLKLKHSPNPPVYQKK